MKKAALIYLITLLNPAIFITAQVSSQQVYYIRGSVFEMGSNTPLRDARVDLKNADSNINTGSARTNGEGQFIFSIKRPYSFVVQVSANGYSSFTSQRSYFGEFQQSVTMQNIYLQKDQSERPPVPPARVDTLPPQRVLEKRFTTLDILPTKGAYDLFYLLNPELKDRNSIPDNYQIKEPRFPSFSESRENFNERFKIDKRKGEPYVSQINSTILNSPVTKKNILCFHSGVASSASQYANTRDYFAQNESIDFESNDAVLYAKPKKFVFVMWKTKVNGEPVTDGSDVTNKYMVWYYQPIKKGDTLAYNKASNATYGYAPMLDNKYLIEVYEQDTGRRVRVSDNEIDPHVHFMKRDIMSLFNVTYIRILIQVYD